MASTNTSTTLTLTMPFPLPAAVPFLPHPPDMEEEEGEV
jgi:hypothetical protein